MMGGSGTTHSLTLLLPSDILLDSPLTKPNWKLESNAVHLHICTDQPSGSHGAEGWNIDLVKKQMISNIPFVFSLSLRTLVKMLSGEKSYNK